MARVPSYDNFQANAASPSSQPFAQPDTSGFLVAPKQQQQLGQAITDAGTVATRIFDDKLEQANKVRVLEATNEARREMLRLAYDPKDGFTQVKGGDVMGVDGQKPLADRYDEQLGGTLSGIEAKLGNDAQRKLFQQQATSLRSQFYGQAQSYQAQEHDRYVVSTYKGTIDLTGQEIAAAGGDVRAIDDALVNRLEPAVRELGVKQGKSESEITADIALIRSNAILKGIETSFSRDDVTTASALLDHYREQILPEERAKVEGVIQKETDGRLVLDIADGVFSGGRTIENIAPSRALQGVEHKSGVPTAEGVKQLIEGTFRGSRVTSTTGGKHATGSDHYKNRAVDVAPVKGLTFNGFIGQLRAQGLNVNVERSLDETIHKSKNWTGPHWHIVWDKPSEKTTTRVTAPSTLGDAISRGRETLLSRRPNASPEVIRATESEITRKWQVLEQDKRDREDDLLSSAFRGLISNGGNVNALPASLRAGIVAAAPEKWDSLIAFGNSLQGGSTKTDDATYLVLSDPNNLKNLTDAQFLAARSKLSESDWQQFAGARAELRSGKTATSAQAINAEATNRVFNSRMSSLGLDTGSKDAKVAMRVGPARRYVDSQIVAAQSRLGRQMTDAETVQFVDNLFVTKTIRFSGGWFSDPENKPLLGMTVGEIPTSEREGIEGALKKRGIPITDENILGAFFQLRGN